MLSLRQRIFLVVGLVLTASLGLFAFFFFAKNRSPKPEPASKADDGFTSPRQEPEEIIGSALKKSELITPVFSPELYVQQLAEIFVERFTSFSNQNENVHLQDVLPLVTSQMASWVETQVVTDSNVYEGISTKVIASSLEQFSAADATVRVNVQQAFEKEGEKEITYRSGKVTLAQENKDWKISGFFWDK